MALISSLSPLYLRRPKAGQTPITAWLTVGCPGNRTRLVRLPVRRLDHYTNRHPKTKMEPVLTRPIHKRTFDAGVAGLEIRDEIPLTWMEFDEISDADVASSSRRAQLVQVRLDVLRTADVERSSDASTGPHSAEPGLGYQHHATFRARGVERLVKAVIGQCAACETRVKEHNVDQTAGWKHRGYSCFAGF